MGMGNTTMQASQRFPEEILSRLYHGKHTVVCNDGSQLNSKQLSIVSVDKIIKIYLH